MFSTEHYLGSTTRKGTSATSLPALATISRTDAERIAVENLQTAAAATVAEGELELEQGCLVYSFDIHVVGRKGVEEVLIDTGTGQVLSHTHESARREVAERAKEQASHAR